MPGEPSVPVEPGGSCRDLLDAAAGPVFRPFALTGGRVRPAGAVLDVVAFLVTGPPPDPATRSRLLPEHLAILAGAQEPVPVAELAARVDLPLGVLRVLLGDLFAAGLVVTYDAPTSSQFPDDDILKAVVDGLRAL